MPCGPHEVYIGMLCLQASWTTQGWLRNALPADRPGLLRLSVTQPLSKASCPEKELSESGILGCALPLTAG